MVRCFGHDYMPGNWNATTKLEAWTNWRLAKRRIDAFLIRLKSAHSATRLLINCSCEAS
jgi:hypothetical protein